MRAVAPSTRARQPGVPGVADDQQPRARQRDVERDPLRCLGDDLHALLGAGGRASEWGQLLLEDDRGGGVEGGVGHDPETLPLAVSPDGRVEDAEARGGAVEEDVAACLRAHEPVADAGELHRLTVRQHDETDRIV